MLLKPGDGETGISKGIPNLVKLFQWWTAGISRPGSHDVGQVMRHQIYDETWREGCTLER